MKRQKKTSVKKNNCTVYWRNITILNYFDKVNVECTFQGNEGGEEFYFCFKKKIELRVYFENLQQPERLRSL
jgi:hypothetical protein